MLLGREGCSADQGASRFLIGMETQLSASLHAVAGSLLSFKRQKPVTPKEFIDL